MHLLQKFILKYPYKIQAVFDMHKNSCFSSPDAFGGSVALVPY